MDAFLLNILPDGRKHLTVDDTLGRRWTIITARAVVGFQWTVYCHRETVPGFVKSLELLHPSGVAHGWIELDDWFDQRSKVLLAVMILLDADVSPSSSDEPPSRSTETSRG